jgi:MFS family permease
MTDQPAFQQTIPSGYTSATASVDQHSILDYEKRDGDLHDVPPQSTEQAPAADEKATPPNQMDPSAFPDGGLRAWLVVMGAFCCLIVSFGWINCIGVFQAYYSTHQLSEYTSQEIAWIPSLEAFCMFAGGLWVGRVYDNYGPRVLLLVGTFFHVFGLMMASISIKYWHFILSQGLCSALGASMIFYPAMSVIFTWFLKKRAFALGVVASGSGLGGIIFPVMVKNLIPEVGFGWTMRICAFLILFLMITANLTVVSRIPPAPRPVKLSDFTSPFKEMPFFLLSVGSFLMFLGLFLPFTFIILVGEGRGVSSDLAVYLVPILNAGSIFGRIIPGRIADKLGRFTVFLVCAITSSILVLALWLPASGTGAAVTFAVLFGFSSGGIVSLAPTLLGSISDVRQIGVRTGVMFSLVAVAVLVGSPIGGQLILGDDGGFRTMQGFSGSMMMAGTACYALLRWRVGGLSLREKV